MIVSIWLTIQFLAMFLMFFQLGLFHMPWYFMLVVLIFCTGVLNAYNFMDGINGMTGGYSMVVIGYLWYINTFEVSFVDNILKPHRKHMYQIRTNELKIPHLVVSGGYCVVQALIVVGFIVTESRYWYAIGVIAFFSVVYVLFMRRYFRLQETPCGI